jgi:hypothetical protein
MQHCSLRRAPRVETDKAFAFPRVSAHLGSLEVSSNNSCDVLVSGAVWQADLRDIYRGSAVDCGEDVCCLSFWRFYRLLLISIVCAIYLGTCMSLAHTSANQSHIVKSNTKVFRDTTVVEISQHCVHTDLFRAFCTSFNSASRKNIPFLIYPFERQRNTACTLH